MGFGGGNASDQARRDEQQRLAAIQATQGRVNAVFDSPGRAADISDFVGAMRTYFNNQLAEQAADTQRNNDFALARGGQFGGSLQVDTQKNFAKDHTKGVLEVERRAQGAGSELEAADQDARGRLISLSTTGLDATTAAAQAAAALRTNLGAARSTQMAQGLGDAFGTLRTFQDRSREAAERRRANRDAGFSNYSTSIWSH
ncbi:MAG: hypothetical protein ACREER_12080 [Alphaproteobacteria bacterium]